MLFNLAIFIVVIGVLIFVHELGHFMAAKAVGIAVPRFSIGFGPATPFRFQRGETEYQVAWIPLGGYVKMASLEEQQAMEALEGGPTGEEYPPERLFESKSLPARILVISAGVIMNVIFAWLAFSAVLAFYGRSETLNVTLGRVEASILPDEAQALTEVPTPSRITSINGETVDSWNGIVDGILDPRSERLRIDFEAPVDPVILEVPGVDSEKRAQIIGSMVPFIEARVGDLAAGRPAAEAGMQVDDLITHIDGEAIASWEDMVAVIEERAGIDMQVTVDRGGSTAELTVTPQAQDVRGADGETRTVGRVGIGPKLEIRRTRLGPLASLGEGARLTWDSGVQVVTFLKGMFLGRVSPRQLGGPILIGQASGQFARAGLDRLLSFMALLSVNLAILNLLPIPVLDGGHLVFLIAEGLRGGKPLSQELRLRLMNIGLVLLLLLMAFAIINDSLRIIGGP